MDIEEIKTFLPHREPMLLVDSLEEEIVTNDNGADLNADFVVGMVVGKLLSGIAAVVAMLLYKMIQKRKRFL